MSLSSGEQLTPIKGLLVSTLAEIGASRKTGTAPRNELERQLQKFLDKRGDEEAASSGDDF